MIDESHPQRAKASPTRKHGRPLPVKPDASYSIAGTWTGWHRVGMTWEGGRFVHTATIGQSGWESFQVLLNGKWETAFYPSIQDGSPLAKYVLRGPDNKGHGRNWTIGRPPDKRLWRNFAMPGDTYMISVFVDQGGMATAVTWQHAERECVGAAGASPKEVSGCGQDPAIADVAGAAAAALEWRPPASGQATSAMPYSRSTGPGWWRVVEARADFDVGDIILLRPGDVALGRSGFASRGGEVLRIQRVEGPLQDVGLLSAAGTEAATADASVGTVASAAGDTLFEPHREGPPAATSDAGGELEVEVWRVPNVRGWGHAPSILLKEATSSLKLRLAPAATIGGLCEAIRAGLPVQVIVWDGKGDGFDHTKSVQALLAEGVRLFYELYHDVRVYRGGLEGYCDPKVLKVTVKASSTLYDVRAAVVKLFWHKLCSMRFVEEEAHGAWKLSDEDARLDGRSEVCAVGSFMDELVAYDADEEAEVHLWDAPHMGKRVRCRVEGTSDAGEHYDIHILPTTDHDAAGGLSDTYVPRVTSDKLRKKASVRRASGEEATARVKPGKPGQPALTRETTVKLLHELLAAYKSEDFQRGMRDLLAHYPDRTGFIPECKYYTGYYAMRKQVLLSVQSDVLPRYGFLGHQGGTVMMVAAISQFAGDQEIDGLSQEANNILQEMYQEKLT